MKKIRKIGLLVMVIGVYAQSIFAMKTSAPVSDLEAARARIAARRSDRSVSPVDRNRMNAEQEKQTGAFTFDLDIAIQGAIRLMRDRTTRLLTESADLRVRVGEDVMNAEQKLCVFNKALLRGVVNVYQIGALKIEKEELEGKLALLQVRLEQLQRIHEQQTAQQEQQRIQDDVVQPGAASGSAVVEAVVEETSALRRMIEKVRSVIGAILSVLPAPGFVDKDYNASDEEE